MYELVEGNMYKLLVVWRSNSWERSYIGTPITQDLYLILTEWRDKFISIKGFIVYFQPVTIKKKWSFFFINCFYSDKTCQRLLEFHKIPSQWVVNFPFKSLNFGSKSKAQSPTWNSFFLINFSCHLILCCWTIVVCCRASCLSSSNSFNYIILCCWASFRSMPNSTANLYVEILNSMGG